VARSKGYTGKGTVLSIGSGGAGETFTPIAQLKTGQFSGQKMNFDDITNFDSPQMGSSGVAMKESLPSSADPGTLAIAGVFLPGDTGYTALDAAYQAGTLTDFKIQLQKGPGQATTGNLYVFSAYVMERPLPDLQWDKVLGFKATLQIQGDITVTVGS
jgi:hypothetical protein